MIAAMKFSRKSTAPEHESSLVEPTDGMAAAIRRASLGFGLALAMAFGLSLAPIDASAQAVRDPANAVELVIGLGFDSARDTSPRSTGRVVIQLLPRYAPNHVARIKELVKSGYYNGKLFHRVIEGFMAQTGSPRGDGIGGAPGKSDLKAEFSDIKFETGVVGMARAASLDSANSQFFIMLDRAQVLDRNYTVVGHVVSGMNTVGALTRTHRPSRKGEIALGATPDRIISAKMLAN